MSDIPKILDGLRKVEDFFVSAHTRLFDEELVHIRQAIQALEQMAENDARYRYFRTRWEDPITWEHRTIYGPEDVNGWDDERVGKCLDAAIDAARKAEEA